MNRRSLILFLLPGLAICAPVRAADPILPAAVAATGGLVNISTRGNVQTGDNVMIAGFIIQGTGTKKVVIRALGPSLASYGLNPLVDPMMELHKPDGSVIYNDDWREPQEFEIHQTTFAPTYPAESVITATLGPGNYTAIVHGKNGGTGMSLVEVYDLSGPDSSRLVNISTRGFVGTGDSVMIGGFIISSGSENTRVLVRAVGPSLAAQGVSGVLADPTLELHNADGSVLSNDNWVDTQQAEIAATGLAPLDTREAAILATLPPGNYTAIVRGRSDSQGVALIEAYQF